MNADYNIQNSGTIGLMLAREQLHNAITLLVKDYSVDDKVESLLERYGKVEDVPPKMGNNIVRE